MFFDITKILMKAFASAASQSPLEVTFIAGFIIALFLGVVGVALTLVLCSIWVPYDVGKSVITHIREKDD